MTSVITAILFMVLLVIISTVEASNFVKTSLTRHGRNVVAASRGEEIAFGLEMATDEYVMILPYNCWFADKNKLGPGTNKLSFVEDGCPVPDVQKVYGIVNHWTDIGTSNTQYNISWNGFRFSDSTTVNLICEVLLCIDQIECDPFNPKNICMIQGGENWDKKTTDEASKPVEKRPKRGLTNVVSKKKFVTKNGDTFYSDSGHYVNQIHIA